jgi:P-type Ca2+ transporter type 2C
MPHRDIELSRLQGLLNATDGLSSSHAAERRLKYGSNHIIEAPPHQWRSLILDTAKDPMLWFFAGTSVVYWLVGQRTEAATLLIAILPLLGMDVFLHRRTQASTQGLRSRLSTNALVVRDDKDTTLPAADLVPGDLVTISTGDSVPADAILVAATGIQIDESILTGEAYPAIKRPMEFIDSICEVLRVDNSHWVSAGTRVLTGNGRIRIVYTGGETIYGEIVKSAIHGVHEMTPLQEAISRLVKMLLLVALGICALLAGVRLWQGRGWLDALVSAVTLGTAAIPEEFPVVFTVFLGIGVYRLAQRQALVRRAVTVENIGRVSCICSDKTGTITEGLLRLAHVILADGVSEPQLLSLASVASRRDSGDPMDVAIFDRIADLFPPASAMPRTRVFPFTEDRKRETGVEERDGEQIVVSKGAVEVMLAVTEMSDIEQASWLAHAADLAKQAHKVVAVVWQSIPLADELPSEPNSGFHFTGLLAFEDPVRAGVREAVEACQTAGIHVIMVTGDHPLTACAIAREVGLGSSEVRHILGDELEHGDSNSPEINFREIVAVTGDGVNDVPALQAADIGLAMGLRGTRSAREVAAIVLLDDNFRTIIGAIGEGRQLFESLQRSFYYLLAIHIPLVATATLIPLAGYPLLYLPVHIVWLEVLIHPTAMLAFQARPSRVLIAQGRAPAVARFFDQQQWVGIALTGSLIAVVVVAGYLRSLNGVGDTDHGRAMALATFILSSVALVSMLSRLNTRAARLLCVGTVISAAILIQTPGVDQLLHLHPLHWSDWALATLAGGIAGAAPMWLTKRNAPGAKD